MLRLFVSDSQEARTVLMEMLAGGKRYAMPPEVAVHIAEAETEHILEHQALGCLYRCEVDMSGFDGRLLVDVLKNTRLLSFYIIRLVALRIVNYKEIHRFSPVFAAMKHEPPFAIPDGRKFEAELRAFESWVEKFPDFAAKYLEEYKEAQRKLDEAENAGAGE